MKLNKRELAECFGVTEETITQWMRNGCPVDVKRRGTEGNVYDTGEVFQWRVSRAEARERGDTESERNRLVAAQADKVELEVAELRGELVRREKMEKEYGESIMQSRARMLLVPPTLAPMIAPAGKVAEVQQIIQAALYEALNELSERYDGLAVDEAVESAA